MICGAADVLLSALAAERDDLAQTLRGAEITVDSLIAARDRLAAEVAKMREALEGVLDVAKSYGGWQAQDDPRCVAARATLAGDTYHLSRDERAVFNAALRRSVKIIDEGDTP